MDIWHVYTECMGQAVRTLQKEENEEVKQHKKETIHEATNERLNKQQQKKYGLKFFCPRLCYTFDICMWCAVRVSAHTQRVHITSHLSLLSFSILSIVIY